MSTALSKFARPLASLLTLALATAVAPSAHAETGVATTSEPAPAITSGSIGATPDLRVARIGYTLAKANADQCARPEMMTGAQFHDIAAYDVSRRADISRRTGLGLGFAVRWFVPGSAADRAGLKPGDEIESLNGVDLAGFAAKSIGESGTYDRVEQFEDYLGAALKLGSAKLTVRHGAQTREVWLAGDAGCSGRLVVYHSGKVNAWSDGKYVAITTRMLEIARTDDELAFVLGHEMSHNNLKHAQKVRGVSALLASFGLPSPVVRNTEVEADRHAITLMANAGFALSGAEEVLHETGKVRVMDFLSFSHPTFGRRVEIVRNAIERVQLDRANALAGVRLAALDHEAGVAPVTTMLMPLPAIAINSDTLTALASLAPSASAIDVDKRVAELAPITTRSDG